MRISDGSSDVCSSDLFATALQGQQPDIGQAMSLVLASLALFGLGIFGPGIASGLVAGAPQLGAGAAIGTALGAGGLKIGRASGRERVCQYVEFMVVAVPFKTKHTTTN